MKKYKVGLWSGDVVIRDVVYVRFQPDWVLFFHSNIYTDGPYTAYPAHVIRGSIKEIVEQVPDDQVHPA